MLPGVVLTPMTIPNVITIIRLFLVPLVVLMIVQGRMQAAFVLFLVAGISDAVDGAIARRFEMKSELGAYLDPLADKALIVSIYITLGITGVIPSWLTILVVARDIMIISAVMISWVMDKPVEIAPIIISKLNTGAQIGFAVLVLGATGFGYNAGAAFDVAQVIVATLTLASMGAYLAVWFRHMAE